MPVDKTALHLAVDNGDIGIVTQLLDAGAPPPLGLREGPASVVGFIHPSPPSLKESPVGENQPPNL